VSDPKVTTAHLRRSAAIYVRQSTLLQVEHNRESTLRQYDLAERAVALGWPRPAIVVIDADLGVSGSGRVARSGFASLIEQIALGQIGIVLALEASRLARNNAEWYRLLDLAAITDTLIGDGDSVYHPGMFDDRLLLGLKGTMSEAELQILRARMLGGLRNKAARGELRVALPVGLVWGPEEGQILLDPDEAVRGAIGAVFEQFAVCGSARGVWLWLREQGLRLPSQQHRQRAWTSATYPAVHKILTHPAYAGAYVYGRTRGERFIDADGAPASRRRAVTGQQDWQVLLPGHHDGYIDWDTYQANQTRLHTNMHPTRGGDGTGAVREGCALLQGLAVCGVCGRRLGVFYRGGAKPAPGYQCNGGVLVGGGQGRRCTRVSGLRVDAAVAEHVLAAVTPLTMQACVAAADHLQSDRDAALDQWRRQAEQARYTATKAERRYRAVDPDNRLVARSLETDWETALTAAQTAEAELARRQGARPIELTPAERAAITTLGADLNLVWTAPTTTDRDRKELLHTLLDEVVITVDPTHPDPDNDTVADDRDSGHARQAHLLLRFKGGLTSQIHTDLPAQKPPYRTDEDTLALIGRLLVHYDDAMIAKVLNQQHRRTARGLSYTAANVATIRRRWNLPAPARDPKPTTPEEEPVSMSEAARQLGVTPSTVYRWINDGLVPAEQLTPGAPWHIRMTDHIRALVAQDAPDGWVPVQVATRALGISRPTLMQRVKRGELRAVHIQAGRKKSLRIELPAPQNGLF
jgi:excisionase family DNA binding protein